MNLFCVHAPFFASLLKQSRKLHGALVSEVSGEVKVAKQRDFVKENQVQDRTGRFQPELW